MAGTHFVPEALDKTAQRMLTGKTPFFACTVDPRFSFGLYIPAAHSTHNVALMTPLFPAGILPDAPFDVHNYKHVLYRGIRFDEVLLGMVRQAAGVWRVEEERFFLHGFSGGGQFAHRFMYLHPERLRGVSVGAPGSVTRPSKGPGDAWPSGLRDVKEVFGREPDFEAVGRLPVQVVVGERDTETGMLGKDEVAGRTRVERAKYLCTALVGRGVRAELTVVPKVGHDGMKVLPALEEWLAALVSN
ncbi:poly hydrolase [Mycena polygramma]|nr:poly hydrolase [Mycena polygramma]